MEAAPVLASVAVLAFAALVYSVVICRQEVSALQDRVYQLEQPRKYRRVESADYPNPPEVYTQPVALQAAAEAPAADHSPQFTKERKRSREETTEETGEKQGKQERVAKMLSGVRKDSKAKFMSLMQDFSKKEGSEGPETKERRETDDIAEPKAAETRAAIHSPHRPSPALSGYKPARSSAFSPGAGLSLTSRSPQFSLGRTGSSPITTPSSESASGPRAGSFMLGPGPAPSLFGRREEPREPLEPQEESLMDRLPYQTREFSNENRQGTGDGHQLGSRRFRDNT